MIRKILSALVGKKPKGKTPNICVGEIDDYYLWRCVDCSIGKSDSMVTMDDKTKEYNNLHNSRAMDEIINSNHGKVCMVKTVKIIGYYCLCGFKVEEQRAYIVKCLRGGRVSPDYIFFRIDGYTEVKEEEL